MYSSLLSWLRRSSAGSILVSTANPGASKAETSIQILATATRRSRRLLLSNAVLRISGPTEALQAELSPGLTALGTPTERNVPEHVVRSYPLDRGHETNAVAAGTRTKDGEQLLGDCWYGEAFRRLTAGYDPTVVDRPPMLAVDDSAIIAEHAGSVVLVIREGADIGEMERVHQRLNFIEQGKDVGTRLFVGYVFVTPGALEGSNLDYALVRRKSNPSDAGAKRARAELGANDTAERHRLTAQWRPNCG